MKKIIPIIAITSILLNIGFIYLFLIKGETMKSNDHRTAITMSEGNKDFVLAEMRDFLESVQQINEGALENNPAKIIAAAKKSGGSVIEHAPKGLLKTLPSGFKKLGFSTHHLFDKIAKDAAENFDKQKTQTQVNTLLNNCISCHKSFKITAQK